MNSNRTPVVKKVSFPDYLASDEIKGDDEYGLQMAQAIQYEWWNRGSNGGDCKYGDRRTKYHNLRLYARGEQDTQLYKDLIAGGDESTYSNFDWRPLQIIPKFVKLLTNQMTERLFDIKAEATDKFSTDLKSKYKQSLEKLVIGKPAMKEAQRVLNIDLMPQNADEMPDSQDEIDLFMKLKYKPAIEIAAEEAMKFTLDLNNYDETQSRVVEDIVTLGIGGIKLNTDPSKGICVDYVDPASCVHSYAKDRNFRNVHYYGEVERITINELQRVSGSTFTNDEMREMAESATEWDRYHNSSTGANSRQEDLPNMMVEVMHFTFKSTNTLSYKKKYNKNGGFKMIRRESTFSKPENTRGNYDVVKKVIDVWYKGTLVLGSNKIYNYGLCENMIRPKGHLNRTLPNYLFYAPELYQNRTKSLVERITQYADQMQQIHIKIQQLIAKARPNGVIIDVDGLDEIDMGDGGTLTPLEVMKIYDETGNVLTTSVTSEGDFNHGKSPIVELNNGVVRGLGELISSYNHYLTLLRDAIGISQGTDASTPHPDMAVGVQEQLSLNSNTATRHVLDAALDISERLGQGLALRIKDVFRYPNLKEAYINAIGKINMSTLTVLKNYALHDVGINIQIRPDMQEKQMLESNIQAALSKDIITLDDAIDIRSIDNIKLANQLLKVRRIRREKKKLEAEKLMEELRQKGAINSANAASQNKQAEIQLKGQSELQTIQAKTQSKILEINTEKEAKFQLMEKEFLYNMQLKGLEVEGKTILEEEKENRKDKRQDRQNSHDSKKIEQRQFNKPAMSFESSSDQISGSMGLEDHNPQ